VTAAESGPYESERQVREAPAVQAILAAVQAAPGRPHLDAHNARMLTTACDSARVELGAYDRRIIAWLAGWEPQTCAVVAGLITRAAATG
jgi:hypothetical protein